MGTQQCRRTRVHPKQVFRFFLAGGKRDGGEEKGSVAFWRCASREIEWGGGRCWRAQSSSERSGANKLPSAGGREATGANEKNERRLGWGGRGGAGGQGAEWCKCGPPGTRLRRAACQRYPALLLGGPLPQPAAQMAAAKRGRGSAQAPEGCNAACPAHYRWKPLLKPVGSGLRAEGGQRRESARGLKQWHTSYATREAAHWHTSITQAGHPPAACKSCCTHKRVCCAHLYMWLKKSKSGRATLRRSTQLPAAAIMGRCWRCRFQSSTQVRPEAL